jgi:hypothetical protein
MFFRIVAVFPFYLLYLDLIKKQSKDTNEAL